MEKYKVGDVVTVEIDGTYGRSMWVEGVVRKIDGELVVKVKGHSSKEDIENGDDYESQIASIDDIIE